MLTKRKDKSIIVFDVGNTLMDFHSKKDDKYKEEKGLEYLLDYLQAEYPDITMEALINDFYGPWVNDLKKRDDLMCEFPIEEYLNNMLAKYNGYMPINKCIEAMKVFFTEYRNNLVVDKCAYDVLKTLKDFDYKLVVLSNTPYYSEIIKECFDLYGLDELIDMYVFSYDVNVAKPKTEMFEYVSNYFKVDGSQIAMVGDSLRKDMYPAYRLGWDTLWLNKLNDDNYLDVKNIIEIEDLNDVLEYALVEETEEEEEEIASFNDEEDDYDISNDI